MQKLDRNKINTGTSELRHSLLIKAIVSHVFSYFDLVALWTVSRSNVIHCIVLRSCYTTRLSVLFNLF